MLLARELKSIVPVVGPLLFLIFTIVRFYDGGLTALPLKGAHWVENVFSVGENGQHSNVLKESFSAPTSHGEFDASEENLAEGTSESSGLTTPTSQGEVLEPNHGLQDLSENSLYDNAKGVHHEVFSVTNADKKYFMIEFGDQEAINPSIIPHPVLDVTWIIVAQQRRSSIKDTVWFVELVCDAVFKNGVLGCISAPMILPIPATFGEKCYGVIEYFRFNVGPHDARVFYGPTKPHTVYGSNSAYTCFGMFMMDFRILVDWTIELLEDQQSRTAIELQRPGPYRDIEKNWFIFWDHNGQMYTHYEVEPKRVFAKLELDGSVGPDLAPLAAASDERCMAKYMPTVGPEHESIHQATNSLSITLCKRSDPSCVPNPSNTFIFTIFQHKSFYDFHSVYEPYVMLFQQTAPFEIYGISQKPIWIHGRGKAGQGKKPDTLTDEQMESWDQTEMIYVTSMSWKMRGQKYHGFSDDVLFLAFGIEDSRTAGIDVLAGDLFSDLGLCFDLY